MTQRENEAHEAKPIAKEADEPDRSSYAEFWQAVVQNEEADCGIDCSGWNAFQRSGYEWIAA